MTQLIGDNNDKAYPIINPYFCHYYEYYLKEYDIKSVRYCPKEALYTNTPIDSILTFEPEFENVSGFWHIGINNSFYNYEEHKTGQFVEEYHLDLDTIIHRWQVKLYKKNASKIADNP